VTNASYFPLFENSSALIDIIQQKACLESASNRPRFGHDHTTSLCYIKNRKLIETKGEQLGKSEPHSLTEQKELS
jgi:hypothetical protein